MLFQILLILLGLLISWFVIKPLVIMMKLKLQFGSTCKIQFGIFGILGLSSQSIIEKMKRKSIPKTVKFIVHNYASAVYILIIDPDYYQFMLNNHENYSQINDLNTSQLLDEGIMFQQGERWKQQRELLIQYFDIDKLKRNLPKLNEIIKQNFKQYDYQNDQIQTTLLIIISDILIQSFFGQDANKLLINNKCIGLETTDLFEALSKLSRKPYSICKNILFGVQALKMFPSSEEQIIQTKINNIKFTIEKIIQKRIVQHELKLDEDENEISQMSEDILNIYIQAYLQTKKGNNRMSFEEIKQQYFTIFKIGSQTTNQIIQASLHYLAEQPQIQNELRQEILSICKTDIISYQELKSLVKLSAFLNEVLRFVNPIPIVRKVQTTHFIKDLKLKRNWVVMVDNSVTNSSEKYYDNPKEFNYQRWLQSESIKENNNYVFIPFSNGPRNCVGQSLATMIYQIILINILRNFEVNVNEKSKNNKSITFVLQNSSFKLSPISQK
ncbi:unnamed protein product (macronuclear) [Paramecium tetraurelia]|uniref:Cytochrome P450 n=1 Tax=Paramecium tetraurelia TaxID=5888 RepID=A0C685_PARTE|nr:uncharacterized protein GSPATT00035431001 [Paramecium tetraurelia]CAK66302.1 unnamed protein product [Paramecium tetraurelia]|eukprot:XP_001433699.1 hypothetical protein (macronuclear) [Paramecium tetraurelia strain d4-2]